MYREYVPQPVYLIERFNRKETDCAWLRLHCIDACQLEGLSREFKYSAGNIERISDLAKHCRPAALARMQLFRWLVFNVLVGNEDAHLKNLSFLLSGKNVRLSPFYDLLCTAVYGTQAFTGHSWPHQSTMAWPIHGVQHLAQITAPLLIVAGEAMGIKSATAKDTIRKMVDNVRSEAPKLLDEVMEENHKIVQIKPEVAAYLAGETRLLRAINTIIISEMTAQLSGGGGERIPRTWSIPSSILIAASSSLMPCCCMRWCARPSLRAPFEPTSGTDLSYGGHEDYTSGPL
ncbi:MAG: HipA domain-containing protein [Pseudoalteromonas distincta]